MAVIRGPFVRPDKLIESGRWTWGVESIDWELYAALDIPVPEDCTAAFCVAVSQNQKILLAREDRGWGLIGGHVEGGESLEETLARECLEEAGFVAKAPVLFAYRKIIAKKPVTHPTPGKSYPFPVSYIAYYYSVNEQTLLAPTEPDILEVGTFTLSEIEAMHIPDYSTIALGWEQYQKNAL
jgi:ADP-ribose pyrophosphatase YjhB (NUDIX family)